MRVKWKLVAKLHQDTSELVMYNLMELLFNSVTEKLKLGSFLSAFSTLKFLWHCGNGTMKQFNLKNNISTTESYIWLEFTASPFFYFCDVHLLWYPLSQHTKFQKQSVSFVRWVNVLILLKIETDSFQNVLCVVIIGKLLMKYSDKTFVKCCEKYIYIYIQLYTQFKFALCNL
jgi:hypothetical protein